MAYTHGWDGDWNTATADRQTGRQASSLMASIHVALLLPMLDFASGWKHSFAVYGIASAFGREIPDCILFTSRCAHVGF